MSLERRKISVIGSGFTGATTAFLIAQKELADVVLVDIPQQESSVQGKALDMIEASPILGFNVTITGTSDYKLTENSDLVIITAGMARKPGMSRDDLVQMNEKIMKDVTQQIVTYSPNTIILVLTNPVDAMTYTVFTQSGFPKERVIGQSGVLDTARFCTFVAQELNISVKDITGFVLGGHGDEMVPLVRYSAAGGVPLEALISQERMEEIIERTRKGGAEIVRLLGNGSAYYAPAAALVEMAESIIKDQRRIMPLIAYLEGEYSMEGIYLGVPAVLGKNGIEKVIELDLTNEEKTALRKSAASVRSVMNFLSN